MENSKEDSALSVAGAQRLFVDMDGTLAVFTPVDKLETLYQQGYFANLKPIENVVAAVKLVIKEHPEIEVNILSSHLSDSPFALAEKNAWLNKHLPEVDKAHRIFPPCGKEKKDYIPQGLRSSDYLLDDYTKNLMQWEPPARGIKLLNGINHTHGTWQKACVNHDTAPQELCENIVAAMKGETQAMENIVSKTIEGQTTVEVLRQRGDVMMLQWHFPNGSTEYSVHNLNVSQTAVINGSYFDEDEKDTCQERFLKRSESITKAAEKDFSGFSYPHHKGKVFFNEPVGVERQAPQAPDSKPESLQRPEPPISAPKTLERISSFVREIRLQQSSMGGEQYFGYRNGAQETDGFDTLSDLIENNEHYRQADVAAEHTQDFNVCSLYYSDGSVTRIKGSEYHVDFAKMQAEKLSEFVDGYLKQSTASNTQAASQPAAASYHPARHRVTDRQIEIAKNTDLVAYLQARGYELTTGSGGWHRWKEHPSFSVNDDGRWAWHSQNIKGGPIDFLTKCENMSFVEAVEALSGSTNTYVPNLAAKRKEHVEEPKPPMKLPPADEKGARAKAYLTKTRGLDPQIVKELMADKLIYESGDYHNVVFVSYDKYGTPKYAAQRGTLTAAEKPFKRDVLNSDKSYGFQLRGTSTSKVAVFEAPIDAISHKCIQKIFKQDYNSINRLALGGVSDKALERYLQDNPQITQITFATDNDEAGHSAATGFMQKYKDLGYTVSRMTPRAKDFNEDLLNIRQELAAEQTQQQAHEADEALEEPAIELELG